MKTERGAVLILVCGALIGIFAALVQQRPAREKRADVLVITALAVPLAAPSLALAAAAPLAALPASSLAMLARISHPNYRHETCRADPALQLFNPVGPELDIEFQLSVPPCARPEQRGYDPDVCLPDGSRPLGPSSHPGNLTIALCQALVPGWRDGYVRGDNQAVFLDESALVHCAGYKRVPPSDHCAHPLDVLVVGYQQLQRVSTLSVRALVYSIELRPRVPWRDAGVLDRFANLTVWGIPFVERPDGSYFADLAPDGHWSDTLGSTTVLASCPGFCRPYPVDIYMCTAECDCMPTTAAPSMTTASPTSASPTTTLPVCSVEVHGGLGVAQTRLPLEVEDIVYIYNTPTQLGTGFSLMSSPFFMNVEISRPFTCVDSCLFEGQIECTRNSAMFGYISLQKQSVNGKYIFDGYTNEFATSDNLVSVTNDAGSSDTYSYRYQCRDNSPFSLADCCVQSQRDGLSWTEFRVKYVVFAFFNPPTACTSTGTQLQFSATPAYLFDVAVARAARTIDLRSGASTAPSEGACVVAFDSRDVSHLPVRLTAWSARDSTNIVRLNGTLNQTCTSCRLRIVMPCRSDLATFTWYVSTDIDAGETSSVTEIFGIDGVPAQPSCATDVPLGVSFDGTILHAGVAVRVIVPSDTTPCATPDPMPVDDAVALALAAAADTALPPCASDTVCIDYR
jgi:hypothetical protein